MGYEHTQPYENQHGKANRNHVDILSFNVTGFVPVSGYIARLRLTLDIS